MNRYRIADDAIPDPKAQIWVETFSAADPSRVAVRREEDGPAGALALIPREWLVEVKPPSIDDPVDLPLRVPAYLGADDKNTTLLIETAGDDAPEGFIASLVVMGQVGIWLDPGECRDAARALWKLGTSGAS